MPPDINISSTTIEKGIDFAKSFLDKLITPAIEEMGLLLKDQVSLWRFNNQVKILNKAKLICEANNIPIKSISPKILCPYLEQCSLEDDELLQEKWANLLSNMVDSRKNIQTNIFPYILSQISKDEFLCLERCNKDKINRIIKIEQKLDQFRISKEIRVQSIKDEINTNVAKIEIAKLEGKDYFTDAIAGNERSNASLQKELKLLKRQELNFFKEIDAPGRISEYSLEEFEKANIIRLGLAQIEYEISSETNRIPNPSFVEDEGEFIEFDVDIASEKFVILTELGELFINACSESTAAHNEDTI